MPDSAIQEVGQGYVSPISVIAVPTQGAMLGRDFQVQVRDVDAEGVGFIKQECRYSVYDCSSSRCTPTVFMARRACGSSFGVRVGPDKDCFSQGEETCRVAVYSKNLAGHANVLSESRGSIRTFGIDLLSPRVTLEQSMLDRATLGVALKARVEDNVEVSNCEIQIDGKGQRGNASLAFSLTECVQEGGRACYGVSGDYVFTSPGTYKLALSCWDLAGNTQRSASYIVEAVKNRAPEISFCRVAPAAGDLSSIFLFEGGASDQDRDAMIYQWEVGDGSFLSGESASYRYQTPGVYRPKLKVQDSFGLQDVCDTAWVQVE